MKLKRHIINWWPAITIAALCPLCEISFPEGLGLLFLLACAPLASRKKIFGTTTIVNLYALAAAGLFIFVRGDQASELPVLFLFTLAVLAGGLVYIAWENSRKIIEVDRNGRLLAAVILLVLIGMAVGIFVWKIDKGFWKMLGPVLAALIVIAHLSPSVTEKRFNKKAYILICLIALGRFGTDIAYYNGIGENPDRSAAQIERYAWFKIPGAYRTAIDNSDQAYAQGNDVQAAIWAKAAFRLAPARVDTALRLATVLEPGEHNRKRLLKRVVAEMPADQIRIHAEKIMKLLSLSKYYSPLAQLVKKLDSSPLKLAGDFCDPELGAWLLNLGRIETGKKMLDLCEEKSRLPAFWDDYAQQYDLIQEKLESLNEYPVVGKAFIVTGSPDKQLNGDSGKPLTIPFTIVPLLPLQNGLHFYARISRSQRLPKRVVLGVRVKSEALVSPGDPAKVEVIVNLDGIKPGSHQFYIGAFNPEDPDAQAMEVALPDGGREEFFYLGTIYVR